MALLRLLHKVFVERAEATNTNYTRKVIMSVLTDTDICKILSTDENQWNQDEQLLVEGFSQDCLTPMGYDLRVGGFYKTFLARPNLVTIDLEESVVIKPRDIALIGTFEKIRMPKNGSVSALILSRVSQVSRGLSHVSTKVDPGWAEGELLVPVQNFSRDSIRLRYQEKFCTIVFFRNESPPSSLYKKGASREKFFRLLAQTSQNSLFRDIGLAAIPVLVIIAIAAIGYKTFGNTTGFAASVAVGVATSQVITIIINRVSSRR